MPNFLDVALVVARLGALACRFDLEVVGQCDSTNARLLERTQRGGASGSVLVAVHQTAGRGRRGRTWISAPGDSLTFSLLWRFARNQALDGLSLAVGVALARALESLAVPDVSLKWPNDVLLKNRKLAGILIEVGQAEPPAVVIGIGINLRLPAAMPADVRACSAALADVAASVSAEELLSALLVCLHATLSEFAEHGFAACRAEWLDRHAYHQRRVALLSDFDPPIDGLCLGVDQDGALLLQTASGVERVISGEISLRPA